MNKKFALIIQYLSGKVVMLTQKPDLIEALKEFIDFQRNKMGWDKSFPLPEIKSAELIPVLYESVYEKE